MRTAAPKTRNHTHSASVTRPHGLTRPRSAGFFTPTGSRGFFPTVQRKAHSDVVVQAKITVSKPSDPLEREADRTAESVMRQPTEAPHPAIRPPAAPRGTPSTSARIPPALTAAKGGAVQRFGKGTPTVAADALDEIKRATTGGQALPSDVRSFMEPRLGADLGGVRVHADESAHSLCNHLSARAFTYRDHVFFGRGQYQPGTDAGRTLLAHELTHTIQQGATVQRAACPQVQRSGLGTVRDYLADKANNIPGFRMLTLVIGFNPINLRSTDRTAANFLRALIELIPGGAVITQALDNHGVIDKAATWVDQKVHELGDIGAEIRGGFSRFIDSLDWTDARHPGVVWDRAKRIFTDPIGHLITFGIGVAGELLSLVKDAILRPLAALAQGTAGYDLLRAALGYDPITRERVPPTADALIGGFMKLIGQEEIWQNIRRGNAVSRAFVWFTGALQGLRGFITSVPQTVIATLTSLTFADVITVAGAFTKIGSAFLNLAGRFFSWALNQVLGLLEIIFSVVAPDAIPYITKAKATFHTIIRDPVRFVGNLVRAGRLGFQRFADRFPVHLKNSLISWLAGPLGEAGVYIPTSFTLMEIAKLVLSVLGLTWQSIRAQLLTIIPDPTLSVLEKTVGVLVTLVAQGPAAAWEQIKGELTELKDQLISQVIQMITSEVVKAAVKKLVSMLNPAGAVIQAIIATYDAVMVFVQKAHQIAAAVAAFIDSIAAIAAGHVDAAAAKVEDTLARTLTVVVAFLARFAGLGAIPARLVDVIRKIRAPVDRGREKIVAWLGAMLTKLAAGAKKAVRNLGDWWRRKIPITGTGAPHTLTFTGESRSARLVVQSTPVDPAAFMRTTAEENGVDADIRETPIAKTEKLTKSIRVQQGILAGYDDNKGAAARGTRRIDADNATKKLDRQMTALGKHFRETFTVTWQIGDPLICGIKITRAKFAEDQLQSIADEAIRMGRKKYVRYYDDGKPLLVAKDTDRRHVVSSQDMINHYQKVLNKKRMSEGKLLLEQRASLPDARVSVRTPVTSKTIQEAATERYKFFFGYAKNIFLGPSGPNRKLGKRLDVAHPEMAGPDQIAEHLSRIKRSFALDGSFTESR